MRRLFDTTYTAVVMLSTEIPEHATVYTVSQKCTNFETVCIA